MPNILKDLGILKDLARKAHEGKLSPSEVSMSLSFLLDAYLNNLALTGEGIVTEEQEEVSTRKVIEE